MAVTQRNFIPSVLILIGLGMFAFFGFSRSEVSEFDSPSNQSNASNGTAVQRDEAAIDEIARQAAEEDVDDQARDARDAENAEAASPSQEDVVQEKNPESQRLNLSGQTVDDSVPTRSADGKFDITFDHIKFDIPEDQPYSSAMLTDQIRQLDGQQVKLRGYIRPSFKQRDLKNFIFVRDDKECCFGPGAALFDCVVVKLAKGKETDYTVRPVAVSGKFILKEYQGPDGNVWAIYRMKDAVVTK